MVRFLMDGRIYRALIIAFFCFFVSCTKNDAIIAIHPGGDSDAISGKQEKAFYNTSGPNTADVILTKGAGESGVLVHLTAGVASSPIPLAATSLRFSADGLVLTMGPGIFEYSPTTVESIKEGRAKAPEATVETICNGVDSAGYSQLQVGPLDGAFSFVGVLLNQKDNIGGDGLVTKQMGSPLVSYQKNGLGTLLIDTSVSSPWDPNYFRATMVGAPSPWSTLTTMFCHLNNVVVPALKPSAVTDLTTNNNVLVTAADPAMRQRLAAKGVSTVTDSVSGKQVFSYGSGESVIELSDFIAVNPANLYNLSGTFRSTGSDQPQTYLGLAPYDAHFNEITNLQAIRYGTAHTVTSVSDTSITTADPITDWQNSPSWSYSRNLGFYFNGDTSKLPDAALYYTYNISMAATDGAYSTANGNTINLNAPMDNMVQYLLAPLTNIFQYFRPPTVPLGNVTQYIIPGTTKVMDHGQGSVYLYTALAGSVPSTWQNYSGPITGQGFGNSPNQFRPNTAYVKIVAILNYNYDPITTPTAPLQNTEFDQILFSKP